MMSLALLLASSVMTQNAGRVKDQEQSRILAVSLADELEKELTVTPSQQEKTQASGTILEFVNSKIISGSWPSGEEQTFSLDSSALNQANELSAQATLSWEEGENGYTDASLYITVHCIYHNMPFSVTTIYNAYTAYATDDENQNEASFGTALSRWITKRASAQILFYQSFITSSMRLFLYTLL